MHRILGRRLAAARRAAGLTQRQAAQRLGVEHQSFIAKCEQGHRKVDPFELVEFARAYGTTVDHLLLAPLTPAEEREKARWDALLAQNRD